MNRNKKRQANVRLPFDSFFVFAAGFGYDVLRAAFDLIVNLTEIISDDTDAGYDDTAEQDLQNDHRGETF